METATVRTTCPYCGVGCGVLATPRPDGSVDIKGDPDHPANFGRLCSKGSALGETLGLEGRQLSPMVDGREVDWDTALDAVANRLTAVREEHGPDAIGLYGSGQLLTEDYYVANKLMKGFIGSANIDTNSRLCMASTVAGHTRAFGADTVPGCYVDLELANLVVLVGSNLAWCHPVLFQRLQAAREKRPGMRLVVIDPRRTDAADAADLHLPIASDGDVTLFTGLLAHLSRTGRLNGEFVRSHTTGIDDALAVATPWTIDRVAEASGLDVANVATFFDWVAANPKTVTVFSQGVNQSTTGTDKVNAIINCHLATARIGQPGMGPFSVTGQPNAMGGREVGGLANTLAAHMGFDDADTVARFWNAPDVARRPGLKAADLFKALRSGEIRALWVMATNPAVSMPDADAASTALSECETLIVSDMYATTETAHHADIFLPAAGWAEKSGTVTNSERRISRQRGFLPLPGQARPDWWIICEVARRMGHRDAFAFDSPAGIFAEHARLSEFENQGTRDFDISSLAAADYADLSPTQWPAGWPRVNHERLFGDSRFFTPEGKARFVSTPPPPGKSLPPGALTLNTGRIRDQWHTMTRTGMAPRLTAHYAEPFVELHPADARRRGIRNATLVDLENRHGHARVRARITHAQQEGTAFAPMHWTRSHASAGGINALTAARTDPISGQPALKMAAVTITPADTALYGFAVSRTRPDLAEADYWALARATQGWRTELGFAKPHDAGGLVAGLFGPEETNDMLSYIDSPTGRAAFAAFQGKELVFAAWFAPDPVLVSRDWAASQLEASHDERAGRTAILLGRPGVGQPDPGPLVCACLGIGANQIAALASEDRAHSVETVGETLGAGTNCGSCRTQIRRILDEQLPQAAE